MIKRLHLTYLFSITFFITNFAIAQITFDWDTNAFTNDDGTLGETIDGVNVTVGNLQGVHFEDLGNLNGTSGNVLVSDLPTDEIIFTFSSPVNVTSIQVVIAGGPTSMNIAFVPDLDSGDSTTNMSVNDSGTLVSLGWTDVTSFSVIPNSDILIGLDDLKIVSTLSTNKASFENVSFYPNPTKDVINFQNISNLKVIKVYDVLGKQILIKTPNSQSDNYIDLRDFDEGIYMVKLKTSYGEVTKKVLKQY